MSNIPNKKLINGLEMPYVGLGTYKATAADDLFTVKKDSSDNTAKPEISEEEVIVKAVKAAIKAGYRHFDCAYIYFNEQHVGKGIREAIAESNGQLKREDFFIVSKCWNTCHSKAKVGKCLDGILERFGLGYLDLYLIHWPMGFKEDDIDIPVDESGNCIDSGVHYTETYLAMEEEVAKGRIKSIGLSNFNPSQIADILKVCKIRPVCNQFEVNPMLQNNEWVDYCNKEDIAVVAYGPFGGPARPWGKPDDPFPLQNPLIISLADKHKKTPGQIILRWLYQRGIVSIPKSVTPSRIEQNAQIFDFELSADEMQSIKNIGPEFRFYGFVISQNHPFFPW